MKAQNCTRRVIESGEFDDILSPEALSEYFGMYYFEQKKALSYNVMDGSVKDTLLELLSLNKNRVEISRLKPAAHNQAFETAGRKFKVIDSDATDVLVPYDDAARELISDLNGELSVSELLEKQRTSRKYTVSVYSGIKKVPGRTGVRLCKIAKTVPNSVYQANCEICTDRCLNFVYRNEKRVKTKSVSKKVDIFRMP